MPPCTSPGVGFLARGGHATECAQLREQRHRALSSHRLGTLGGKVGCLGAEAERPGPMGEDRQHREEAAARGETTRRPGPQHWGRRTVRESTGYGTRRRPSVSCFDVSHTQASKTRPTRGSSRRPHNETQGGGRRREPPAAPAHHSPTHRAAPPRPLRAHRLGSASPKDGWRMRPGRALVARASPCARPPACG